MCRNDILSLLTKHLGFDMTGSQQFAAEQLVDFLTSKDPNQCFLLKGYAGTGKTSLIASAVKTLAAARVRVVLLAPTGRAAKVLSSYAGLAAYTIHRWIYRVKSAARTDASFVLSNNTLENAVFIVDEASMISNYSPNNSLFGSGRLLDDLMEYVYGAQNCRLVLVGDQAQLPPVKLEISPALDPNVLAGYGLEVMQATLNDVVRQAEKSGILHNATIIRDILSGSKITTPKFELEGFDDIKRINGAEFQEEIEGLYGKDGVEETIIVNYSNKRANAFNMGIRNQILWHEEEISNSDLLMVVRNNYFWSEEIKEIPFIANGDIVQVQRIHGIKELYDFRFAEATICLLDYKGQELTVNILLDTLQTDGPSLPTEKYKLLYERVAEDYAGETTKGGLARKIKTDSYFNALQVKFAYAITCHKSQGGQWRNVFIDQGFFREEMISREYLRWLYTAFTRATDRLYLVNFSDVFFR